MIVTTPSGRDIEIRRTKGKDEDIITNTDYARSGKTLTMFLASVTGLSAEELDDMLIGDRMFLFIEIRKLCKGNLYYPRVQTPFGTTEVQEVDLSTLKNLTLDRTLVEAGYTFEEIFPICKKVYKARLLKGKDERTLQKLRMDYPDKFLSYLMLHRTVEIEGEKTKNIAFFEDLDSEDTAFFRDEYQRRDIGYETRIEGYSKIAGQSFEYELPLDASFFFSARKNS